VECNQRWHTIRVPPFVVDMTFDGDGNAWFATTHGPLFWDFNGTPEDTSDDSWQVFGEFDGFAYAFQGIVIDSQGTKWVLAGRLHRLDDHGTPTNAADDTWENYELTFWRSPGTRRIVLGDDDRLWWLGQAGTGIKVLPASELYAGPPEVTDERWVALFTTELVHDLVVSDDAVWIATESGVYHVSLGETLADENDDIWTDVSQAPGLSGQTVSDLRS